MKKWIFTLIAVLFFLLLSASGLAAESISHPAMPSTESLIRGYCPRVVDGDTVYFEVVEDGIPVAHTFRLIGVDTPETVHPNKPLEPWGKEASAFTAEMLLDKWAYIEYDIERTDAYDRHLGYIWLEDGTLFNLTLLERGLGKFLVIAPNVRYSAHLIAAQKSAQNNQVGIWSPLPKISLDIDLSTLSLEELYALQTMITEELLRR